MDKYDKNRDPISGAPGAHPVGTGVGAVAGGIAAGAAAGTVAGPIGTAVGAAVGAIAGGLMGKGVAEMIDPTAEDAYWRDNYSSRPYVTPGSPYDEGESKHGRASDDDGGKSRHEWEYAKDATRDSWQRVSDTIERAVPGDSDRDGK
jgi:hypothetical protein